MHMTSLFSQRWTIRVSVLSLVCCSTLSAQHPARQGFATQPISQPNNRQLPANQQQSQLNQQPAALANPANQVGPGVAQPKPQANGPQGQSIPIVQVDQAVNEGVARLVKQPFPELSPQEVEYIEKVLSLWENRTIKITTFECKFKRFVFDPAANETHAVSIGQGYIRYKNPDKGVYKEEGKYTLAGRKPDGSPDYKENPDQVFGDWWVCDGEWVHNLDRTKKEAVRTQLPPELRGNNIPLSPLPFLFGVKAAEMKARYFVRPIAPPPAPAPGHNDVWVEAWPKRADDAGNYSRVQIALDKNDFLPNAMILFMPNWSADAPYREVYNFGQREVNNLLDKLKENLFMQTFIDTKVGSDWNVIKEPWIPVEQRPQSQPQYAPNGLSQPGQPNAPRQGQPNPSAPLQPSGGRVATPGQSLQPVR
jgi:TIGR03009 family protein